MTITLRVFGYSVLTIDVEYDLTPSVVKPVNNLIRGVSRRWTEKMLGT
jgi:hypothetical protein